MSIKSFLLQLFLVLMFLGSCKELDSIRSGAEPINHQQWNAILNLCVDSSGWVNYPCMMDNSRQLMDYIDLLEAHHPDIETWSREQRMVYWINAYNAYTIRLIIEHYPLESIKDIKKGVSIPFINSVWDDPIGNIQGIGYSLNDMEHRILRKKFDEPRVHFALNCASKSCPILLNRSYEAESLDSLLEVQTHVFFSDTLKNKLIGNTFFTSKILLWYRGDFTVHGSIEDFIRSEYGGELPVPLNISYLDYDWSLNELPKSKK